jgi:hypothetical protein
MDNFISILSSIISIIGAAVGMSLFNDKLSIFIKKIGNNKADETFSSKVEKLNSKLKKTSEEADVIIKEIETLTTERVEKVKKMEDEINVLADKEKQLNERIETLRNVPIEAVKQFEELLNKDNRRSARRDFVLFGLGVVVSTVITIVLKVLFNI